MASSSSRSSPFDDDEDDYSNLMSTATPISSPARKRTADDAGLDESDPEPPAAISSALSLRPNGNHLQAVSAFATRKRLRPEQVAEVEGFLRDPVPVQLAKLFITLKANENTLAKFQAAQPKFEINSVLKTNITRAVNATLCSSQITQYKGELAKNDVQTLLTRHRWGNFVVGTEHDKSAMDVVQKFIGEVFTQSRSVIKKEILKSVEVPKPTGEARKKFTPALRDATTHTTIYQLTKIIALKLSGGKTVSIPITPAFCARVALMRKWHVKMFNKGTSNKDDYWEQVDKDLKKIRTQARNDTEDMDEIAKCVARAFSSILENDRKHHGSNAAEEIPDATSTADEAVISYQADVDETIEARSRGQTISKVPGTSTEGDSDGNDPDVYGVCQIIGFMVASTYSGGLPARMNGRATAMELAGYHRTNQPKPGSPGSTRDLLAGKSAGFQLGFIWTPMFGIYRGRLKPESFLNFEHLLDAWDGSARGTSHGAFTSGSTKQLGCNQGKGRGKGPLKGMLEALDMSVRTTQMECLESLSWSDSSTPGEVKFSQNTLHGSACGHSI
ncbi:hypothetical protein B0H11DRAFT_2428505 [Mycena galericulata]|nr:hypothetical protein B0H11DRAFT_2428505 [Mycena galericulata]